MCCTTTIGGSGGRSPSNNTLERGRPARRDAQRDALVGQILGAGVGNVLGLRLGRRLRSARRCLRSARISRIRRTSMPADGADFPHQLLAHRQFGVHAVVGLGHVIERAAFQGVERDVRAQLGERTDHDDRQRAAAQDGVERVEAVHVRHLHVERDDVGIDLVEAFQRLPAVRGRAGDGHARRFVDRCPK